MLRGLAVWFLIVIAESVHGTLREIFLAPRVGAELSGRIGWPVALVIVFVIALILAKWVGLRQSAGLLRLGLVWAALTFVFEIGVGFARGFDGARIMTEINPFAEGLMLYSLLAMVFAPLAAARLRGLTAPVA